jgi:hypothetical protein
MAVQININIQLVNPSYEDESSNLQHTLLPFLNMIDDYSFLKEEASYLMSRFIKSLTNHIIDN